MDSGTLSFNLMVLGVVALVSLLGLVLGIVLLYKENLARRAWHFLVSFGAGSLIGITFFDLMPEALEGGDPHDILKAVLAGFLFFYLLEKVLSWYHTHDLKEIDHLKVPRYLIVLGDFLHNLIDGVLIVITFMVDVRLGVITSFGIVLHELPQEVADFAILYRSGLSRTKVIAYNLLSAAGAVIGALAAMLFGEHVAKASPWLLAIVAGNFLYLAAVDLIPATHHHKGEGKSDIAYHAFVFVVGIAVMWGISSAIPHTHGSEGHDDHAHQAVVVELDHDTHDEDDHDH